MRCLQLQALAEKISSPFFLETPAEFENLMLRSGFDPGKTAASQEAFTVIRFRNKTMTSALDPLKAGK